MSNPKEEIESNIDKDPWHKKATTTVRYDLCSKCKFFLPQKPYEPGIRCRFGLRPDVIFENDKAVAKCEVFHC